jgi:hypothetical protein
VGAAQEFEQLLARCADPTVFDHDLDALVENDTLHVPTMTLNVTTTTLSVSAMTPSMHQQ